MDAASTSSEFNNVFVILFLVLDASDGQMV